MLKHRFISALFLFLFPLFTVGQSINLGAPPVRHFTKKDYRAGTQNWEMAQDARGLIWCANNEGLLCFDGVYWSLYPVANRTIVRSLLLHPDGRIFTGAQSEFGYFFPDSRGVLVYHSLNHLFPADQSRFADVWDIAFSGNEILFRTDDAVFAYDGKRIQAIFSGSLTAMFATSGGVLLQTGFSELRRYENGQFQPFLNDSRLNSAITAAFPFGADSTLLTTLKNGIFLLHQQSVQPWTTPYDQLFQEKRIYSATRLPDGRIAVGTSLYGLLVLDGQRRLMYHGDKENGLQNTNVLHTFADRSGKVWLGLDNGIDCVDMSARFTAIIPDGSLEGAGYAAAVFNGHFYLGVSNGLYEAPWQSYYNPENAPFFKKINASDGQVWGVQAVGGQLLMGHHEGAFRVDGAQVSRISANQGAWTFVPLDDQYMMGGTYNGLVLYQKTGSGWAPVHQFSELKESCRIMVKDDRGYIWVSHPYRGVFRVEWSSRRPASIGVKFYNAANGLPSDLNNYVFGISGKAVVGSAKGVYRYEPARDIFAADSLFAQALGPGRWVKYLCQDGKGNIWYRADDEVGLLRVDDFGLKKTFEKQVFPELSEKMVGGFEMIYPLNPENVIIGTEQGVLHFDPSARLRADTVLSIRLNSVMISDGGDSLVFGGFFTHNGQIADRQPSNTTALFDAGQNNLRFAFSAVDYGDPRLVSYRTRLEGMDKSWSEWHSTPERIITNLSPGNYTFLVQARRPDGLESTVLEYRFRIRPPWYAAPLAIALYGLALLGLFGGVWYRQKMHFEREKAALTEQHQQKEEEHLRAVEATQANLIAVENEKLEAEIRFKNQELASATMHLVQKGEMLVSISETLHQILEKSHNPEVKREIQQLLNLLNFDQKLDEDWEQFAFHFDQVHVDFLSRVREKFPQLSPNDHKLCAYLRMNLTTKEIAPLMNISVRGVEASRYRLRKRLNLPTDMDLNEFVMRV